MTVQSAQQECLQILERHGGAVADEARTILLEDPKLKELREQLQFMKDNWRDLTPALMSLSCEAVGGEPQETHDAALAISLINYSFTIWDDLIDNAKNKTFKPTTFGKFGQAQTIIIGGLSATKAFTILNEANYSDYIRKSIMQSVWNLWCKIAVVETLTLNLREQGTITSKQKFEKIKSEVIDLGLVLKVGAIIGNGSSKERNHLEKYGKYLGIILALKQDFEVSVNLTLELSEKIRNNRLPYLILWAMEQNASLKLELVSLRQKEVIDSDSVKMLVQHLLDTEIIAHTKENINHYEKKAKSELSYMPTNTASLLLEALVELQLKIFIEHLS